MRFIEYLVCSSEKLLARCQSKPIRFSKFFSNRYSIEVFLQCFSRLLPKTIVMTKFNVRMLDQCDHGLLLRVSPTVAEPSCNELFHVALRHDRPAEMGGCSM